jgi:hypothetical protein
MMAAEIRMMPGRLSIGTVVNKAQAEKRICEIVDTFVAYEDAFAVVSGMVLLDFLPHGARAEQPIEGAHGMQFRREIERYMLRRWESTTRASFVRIAYEDAIRQLRWSMQEAGLDNSLAGTLLDTLASEHHTGTRADEARKLQDERERRARQEA